MKHLLVSIILAILISFLIPEQTNAVGAYPYPVKISQRDGTKMTIILQGDEWLKFAKTLDGYTLMYNSAGIYEYAVLNGSGDLIPSGVKAHDIQARTPEERTLLARTPVNLFFSPGQVSVMRQIREQAANLKSGSSLKSSGTRKLVCILIGYTDLPFTKTNAEFQDLFNQVGYSVDGANGSVKDFFNESSYNQLNLTMDIAGPYTASNTMAYYGANNILGDDVRPRQLVTEAVALANPDVNYADYDFDGNGYVDGVFMIFAGYGEETGASADAIWSHAWSITPVSYDGKTITTYSCSPELRGNSGTGLNRIGVICHELGHTLGAPDYYDTNGSTGGQFTGTGYWDLQGSGNWNNSGITPAQPNPYTKIYIYGWASATTINSMTNLVLQNAAENSNSFYRINTNTSGEFYLLENRQQVGFDAHIPGHGLMIYHVSANIASPINATYPQEMYPVCADAGTDPGTTAASYGSINDDGCPFPGTGAKTSFTDATLPSMKSWAGAFTGKPVTNITEDNTAKTISFSFMSLAPSQPGVITGVASQCPGVTGQVYSISAVSGATSYTWTVPAGWTITAGGTSTSITVTTGTAGQNGDISVTASNTVGTSAARTLAVTVNSAASVGSVTGATPLCINATATYTANSVILGGGTGAWSSSNTAIATVNATSGLVTAKAVGTCNIVYTITGGCGGTKTAQQSLTVTANASVASVTGTTPLCIAGTASYTANTVVLSGGTGAWSSSNTAVATVDPSTGLVTGVTAGTCNIVYTITGGCGGTKTAQKALTINADASVGSVTGTTPLCATATATYSAVSVVLSGGTGAWSSSDTNVATVNSSTGLVTGVAAGTCDIVFTITGGCGGTKTAQQSVTVTVAASVASVTGTTPLCAAATATYTAGSVVLSGGTGAWSSSNTGVAGVDPSTGLVTGVAAGTCNIIYTITGGCGGTKTAQQAVTINAAASVASVTGTTPLCETATTTYSAVSVVLSGGTGAWSSSNSNVATVNPTTGLVTGVAAGTCDIIYTITGGCGGTKTAQQTVTVSPAASVGSVTGTTPICATGTTTYSANSVILSGGTGVWSSSNTSVATVNPSTGLVTGVAAGTCNIIYTLTGGCGGTKTAQQPITVTAAANVASVTGTTPLCTAGTATYSAGSVVLAGGTGAWSSSNTNVATVNPTSGLVTGVAAGTCDIIYTITGGCGGTKSAQQAVTISAAASVGSVSGTTPLCATATAAYSANSVVLSGGTGAWSSSNTSVATVNPSSGLVTGVAAGTCDIIFTITGGCGGTKSAQQAVTITAAASVASVTGSSPVCTAETAAYSTGSVVLAGGTGAWSSSNSNVASVNPSTGLVTGVNAGTCDIIYTITGGCGGTKTAQQAITVTPAASVASVTGTTPLCAGATATYTANSVVLAGGTGAWSSSNTNVATVNPLTGLVTGVNAGACDIIFTITGGCGGTKTKQLSVTVTAAASVGSITGTTPLCAASTTTYTASSIVLAGGTGSWSSSNPSVATVNPSTGLVTGIAGGTCNIIYTITGGCGGTRTAQQPVTITAAASVASVAGHTPLCIAATATWSAVSVVTGGGTGAWSSSNTNVATVDPTTGLVTGVAAGNCNIIYTITGGCGGTKTAQQSVTITETASIASVTGTSPLCASSTASYSANSVVLSDGTGTWSSSNINVATVNASTGLVTGVAAGTCDIIYTVTGGCGGTKSAQQPITIIPTAGVSSVTGAGAVCPGTSTTYLASNVILSGGTGAWSSSNTLVATVNAATGTVTGVSPGTCNIVFTITGACGGTKSAQQPITVENGAPAQPAGISGNTLLCPNLAGQVYAVNPVATASMYTWNVPAGWTITSGAGTASITVASGQTGQGGILSVAAANSCGTSTASTLDVSVSAGAPGNPGVISGATVQTAGTSGQQYSIQTVAGASFYNWAVPTGWTITAGATTSSITVTAGTAGQNGTISVSAGNDCGTGPSSTLGVTAIPVTSNDATLLNLTVNGITIAGFSPSILEYSVRLPYGVTIAPTVNGITNHERATRITVQAAGVPGTANIEVTAENGVDKKLYKVNFSNEPNTDATLRDLRYNGTIVQAFGPLIFAYTLQVPFATPAPALLSAIATDPNAAVLITQIGAIPGSGTVQVTAADGITVKTYTVSVSRTDPSHDATLLMIYTDGFELPGFAPARTTYTIDLPCNHTGFPAITATRSDSYANLSISTFNSYPGTARLTVTAQDGSTQVVYELAFRIKCSSEARLATLSIFGATLPGFDKDTYGYTLTGLPDRTAFDASTLAYTTLHGNATAALTITEDKTGDGYFRRLTIEIAVTAEDGVTHQAYTIEMKFLLSGTDDTRLTARLNVYPNPSSGRFEMEYIQDQPAGNRLLVTLTDLSGRVVYATFPDPAGFSTNITIDLPDCGPGMYFLAVRSATGILMKKIIIE
jgi:M6 family metalloprotease-like protein